MTGSFSIYKEIQICQTHSATACRVVYADLPGAHLSGKYADRRVLVLSVYGSI